VSRPRSTSTERERSRRRLLAFWRAFALGTLGLLTVHERSHALGELGLLRVGLLLGEVAGGDLLVDAGADVRNESVDDRLRVDIVGLGDLRDGLVVLQCLAQCVLLDADGRRRRLEVTTTVPAAPAGTTLLALRLLLLGTGENRAEERTSGERRTCHCEAGD